MLLTAGTWRVLFFVGIILINLMLPFRAKAMQAGGWHRFSWSAGVVLIGAFLLWALYQLRLHRLAKVQTQVLSNTSENAPKTTTPAPPKPLRKMRKKRRS